MVALQDQEQRQKALDPTTSFIVQAPAGSGKTELLTRRVLKLLAEACREPEEIIAITFTRKAAAEMRERIIQALKQANSQPYDDTKDSHDTNCALARQALKRDEQQGWGLLQAPNRLRIMTIDALCATLTRQMPVTAHFGAQPAIAENAKDYYRAAVRDLFQYLSKNTPLAYALTSLLKHLDNRLQRLETLLIGMLAHRDQWLELIHKHNDSDTMRQILEQGLQHCRRDIIDHCSQTCPDELFNEIINLTNFSLANCQVNETVSYIDPHHLTLADWQKIARTFLTQNGQWLKKVSKTQGFPSPNATQNEQLATYYKTMKERMHELLRQLCDNENLRLALTEARYAPPASYEEDQWQLLLDLCYVLKYLCAHLNLTFQQYAVVDFIEVVAGAQQALGDNTSPSELALKLDYQINHLLIDEFQDTSRTHFRLIQQLTEGWTPCDGRTLFLVGDPMQSIYRFRQADVGIFLHIWQHGLHHLPINPLRLCTNFRSNPQLIDWLNHKFAPLFPEHTDISLGAVPFSHAHPGQDQDQYPDNHPVSLYSFTQGERLDEAQAVCRYIQDLQQQYPHESIALLVRSRNHLQQFIKALQQHNITYTGVEIETLAERSIIQDLYALTRALLHPADRTAWLAILRAPWCGLSLEDLYKLANVDLQATIYNNMQLISYDELSTDGAQRLRHFTCIIERSLKEVRRLALRDWIAYTWEALGGPACINTVSDYNNVLSYLELLESMETAGDLVDLSQLEQRLNQLYASPTAQNSQLQIMTIHKSKGLEFDTVIIPSLDRTPPTPEAQLLRWLERTRTDGESDLIMAPIQAQNTQEPIYRFLGTEDKKRQRHELLRLCYVAMSRACKRLCLTAFLTDKTPPANSFLEMLAPSLSPALQANTYSVEQNDTTGYATPIPQLHWRLPNGYQPWSITEIYWSPTPPISQQVQQETDQSPQDSSSLVGSIIHQYIEKITKEGIEHWNIERVKQNRDQWQRTFQEAGLPETAQSQWRQVELALANMLTDPIGQWLLQSHYQGQSEYALTANIDQQCQSYVIDRTFVDAHQQRWIVDYKTAMPDELESSQLFLARQWQYHETQLHTYARLFTLSENLPIMIGLYFPLVKLWTYQCYNQ